MSTHKSGKRVAAGITAVAAIGSLSVAGFGAVSLGAATAGTQTATSPVSNQGSEANPAITSPQTDAAPRTGAAKKAPNVTKRRSASTSSRSASPVTPGNGAATHAKSSGS